MQELSVKQKIPKTIWIFWSQGADNAPKLVKKCISSWKEHNPDWTVKVLSDQDIDEFDKKIFGVDLAKNITLNHKSDLLRVYLLSLFGGVWADATLLCNKPLDSWISNYLESGFFAFHSPGKDREIASWFIASEQGHVLTTKLYSEFKEFWVNNKFGEFTPLQKKLLNVFSRLLNKNKRSALLWFHPLFTKMIKIYPYFIFHYQFYKLISKNGDLKKIWKETPKYSADGPHLPSALGLTNCVGERERKLLKADSSPVYKLNWRLDNSVDELNSVLSFVLNNKCSI